MCLFYRLSTPLRLISLCCHPSKLRSLFNQLTTITYAILTMVHSKRQLTFSAGIMSALEVFYVFIYLSVEDFSHLQHS